MDLLTGDKQTEQPPQKTRRVTPRNRIEDPIFRELEEVHEDQDLEAEDDDAGSQLSESFAQMDIEDQGDQDSSSVSNSEVTIQQAGNTGVESQTVPTQRQIEMMKSEPNSSSQTGYSPYEFTPPMQEPEVSAGSEEEDTNPTTDNIRGVSKSTRTVRQTQFYGNPIASTTRGIFVCDHDINDLDRMKMTQAEKEFNPELLFRSRCDEISGWINNDVFEEIFSTDVGSDAVIIGTRWVDSCVTQITTSSQRKSGRFF